MPPKTSRERRSYPPVGVEGVEVGAAADGVFAKLGIASRAQLRSALCKCHRLPDLAWLREPWPSLCGRLRSPRELAPSHRGCAASRKASVPYLCWEVSRSRPRQPTIRVSVASSGVQANGASQNATIRIGALGDEGAQPRLEAHFAPATAPPRRYDRGTGGPERPARRATPHLTAHSELAS